MDVKSKTQGREGGDCGGSSIAEQWEGNPNRRHDSQGHTHIYGDVKENEAGDTGNQENADPVTSLLGDAD